MNKSSQFYGWIVMAIIMVFPIPRAEAVPPGGMAEAFLEMQSALEEISQQIKGLLRVSSVQNVSLVKTKDLAGIDALEINITTTEEGPFVIMFNALTTVFGPIGDREKGRITTLILLDDVALLPFPNTRSISPEFDGDNEINSTTTVAAVQPGEHLIKILLKCSTNVVSTCADLELDAVLANGAQLTVIHPM